MGMSPEARTALVARAFRLIDLHVVTSDDFDDLDAEPPPGVGVSNLTEDERELLETGVLAGIYVMGRHLHEQGLIPDLFA